MVKHVFDLPSPCQLRHLALFWVSYFFPFKAWGGCPFLKVSYRVTMNMCPCRFPESDCFVGHFRHWFTFKVFFFCRFSILHTTTQSFLILVLTRVFPSLPNIIFFSPSLPIFFFKIKIELIAFSRFFPSLFFPHFPPPETPPFSILYLLQITIYWSFLGGEVRCSPLA